MDKVELFNLGIFNDSQYFDEYCELVFSAPKTKLRQKTQGFENHHILPRSWFKDNGKKQDDTENNCVKLSFDKHILAHYYLALALLPGQLQRKQVIAFNLMIGYDRYAILLSEDKLTQDLQKFSELRESYRKINRDAHIGKVQSEETIRKKSEAMKLAHLKEDPIKKENRLKKIGDSNRGKVRTAEQRARISEAMKGKGLGRVLSSETKEKIRQSNLGKPHNGSKHKTPMSEEHKRKLALCTKGKAWWTDGVSETLAHDCPQGFHKGRKKTLGFQAQALM